MYVKPSNDTWEFLKYETGTHLDSEGGYPGDIWTFGAFALVTHGTSLHNQGIDIYDIQALNDVCEVARQKAYVEEREELDTEDDCKRFMRDWIYELIDDVKQNPDTLELIKHWD